MALGCGDAFWVKAKRIRSQIQAESMSFLGKGTELRLRGRLRSLIIGVKLRVQLLFLPTGQSQKYLDSLGKISSFGGFPWLERDPVMDQDFPGIVYPIWLGTHWKCCWEGEVWNILLISLPL